MKLKIQIEYERDMFALGYLKESSCTLSETRDRDVNLNFFVWDNKRVNREKKTQWDSKERMR